MRAIQHIIGGVRPLVGTALLVVSAAMIAVYQLPMFCIALPMGLGIAFGFKSGKKMILALSLPILFLGYSLWRMPSPDKDDLSQFVCYRHCIFRATTIEILSSNEAKTQRIIVAPEELLFPGHKMLSGRAIVTIFGAIKIEQGQRLEIKARLAKPTAPSFPWQFNYRDYLARRGIYCLALATLSDVRTIAQQTLASEFQEMPWQATMKRLIKYVETIRSHIISTHRKFAGDGEGDLLSSMVLGDRVVDLPATMTSSFRDVGLSHLLAASGFNLTIVIGVTWWLARLIVRVEAVVNFLCFLSMVLFVCLAGPSPSVLRAALMCTLLLISRSMFRTFNVGSALSFALIITLLVDPGSIADIGLQFSYVATAGIVCGAKPLTALLMRGKEHWLLRWLSETTAVVLVAQFSVLALQLQYFWQVGLFFLPANLLVAPVVPCITALGFASSVAVVLDPQCAFVALPVAVLDWLVACLLRWMLLVVNFLASWQDCKLVLGPPPIGCLLFYYGAFLSFIMALHARRQRVVCFGVFSLSIMILLWRAPPPLTVACFPRGVVVIDANRHAICLGGQDDFQIQRFITYFGARLNEIGTRPIRCISYDGADLIELEMSQSCILVMHEDFETSKLPTKLPRCLLLVCQVGKSHKSRDFCRELLDVANAYRPSWVVLSGDKHRKPSLDRQRVAWILKTDGTNAITMGKEEVVFVLDGSSETLDLVRM